MTLSRPMKVILALATAWTPLYVVIFFGAIVTTMFGVVARTSAPNDVVSTFEYVILPLHAMTMLLSFALLFVYLAHVFRNPRLPEQEKLLWALLIFVGHFIAMTIYFLRFVWPDDPAAPDPSPEG